VLNVVAMATTPNSHKEHQRISIFAKATKVEKHFHQTESY
jgi:hypothetical protein